VTNRRQFIASAGGVLISSWLGKRALASGIQGELVRTAPVIRVLGVGGAGCNIVEQIRREQIAGIDCTVLIGRSMERRELDVRLETGFDGELNETGVAAIRTAVQRADTVFVVAGLGGKTGTRIAPAVARAAKTAGAEVVAMVTEPFDLEGGRRRRAAEHGLNALVGSSDMVIRFSNEECFRRVAMDVEVPLLTLYGEVNDGIVLRLREMLAEFAAVG
jgi:cell division protein FtsZ